MQQLGHRFSTQTAAMRLKLVRVHALLLMCLMLGLIAGAVVRAAEPESELPPFRIDLDLPPQIVLNAEQGLGQCHWLAPSVLSNPHVSWAYDSGETASGWVTIEPQEGTFNWAPLDAEIAKARDLGKHIWLELHTSEGHTPQWARDAGVVVVGSRGGTPAPWNETYQRLLRRAVHAMAARYDEDPTVDAINLMAGGCYGEMVICAPQVDRRAWEGAGYTDTRFIEAVRQIIDIYLEEEYEWEDGNRTHGFLKTPVVLQLGGGLYGHTTAVIRPVVEYAMSRYGMRVWLKYNGFGGGYDMGWLYQEYNMATRVGYEPAGNSLDFLMKPKEYIRTALDQHASYLCLQEPYFNIFDPKWKEARELAARYLGTQIANQGVDAPDLVLAGQQYVFITDWVNRGTAPLIRPKRQGEKDVPASYDILIAFVDAASGSPEFSYSFTPAVPTTNWYTAEPIRIEKAIEIPRSVSAGKYDLQIALFNPNLPPGDEQRYLRLVNVDLRDGSGRYTVGQITVLNEATPTPTIRAGPTPTPTPLPGETGNWLSRLLRSIWEWFRGLLDRLQ
jgi:hypothetical protein